MSPMFFQNLRPDDRAFNNPCPMSEIEFNCLPSIKHFVNCGHNPPDAWQDSVGREAEKQREHSYPDRQHHGCQQNTSATGT